MARPPKLPLGARMGLTFCTPAVGNPADPKANKEVKFLIDSRTIYSHKRSRH